MIMLRAVIRIQIGSMKHMIRNRIWGVGGNSISVWLYLRLDQAKLTLLHKIISVKWTFPRFHIMYYNSKSESIYNYNINFTNSISFHLKIIMFMFKAVSSINGKLQCICIKYKLINNWNQIQRFVFLYNVHWTYMFVYIYVYR